MRFRAFELGCRLWGALLLLLAALAPHVGLPVALWAAIALLRVPRRRLLVELAAGFALLALTALEPPLVALSALCLATSLLAPEEGTFPMNGLDRYFVSQEYPGVAANSHLVLDSERPWDRPRLEAAVAALLARVGPLRSFVREAPLGMERLVARGGAFCNADVLEWRELPEVASWYDRPMDLARRPAWKVLHAPREGGGFRLVVSVHHGLTDGTGQIWLLRALLAACRDPAGELPALPPSRRFRDLLRPRGLPWILRMTRRHVRPMDKVGVQNASLLDDETPRRASIAARHVAVDPALWERLHAAAEARGVSRNDLCVAAALAVAAERRRAAGRPPRPYRVLLPTDLRPTFDLPPSLQNFVGVVRALFTAGEVDDAAALPALVHERVALGRTLEEAVETPVNLGVLSALLPPFAFRSALRAFDDDPRSFFFSMLASTVRIPRDVELPPTLGAVTIWLRGALTRQPGFGIVLTLHGERAIVTCEYLEGYVSEASVTDFQRRYLERLDALAAGP